jgi:RNA polymerase sigma factor (sigma-70 family)
MQNVDAVDVSGAELDLVDLDDGSLLAMARSGNSDAYAALFSRYSYAAHRLARHLGQKEDSDDVVSEAFAQVLDLLGRGKGPETAFRAYLFTTVRHECARRAKARKRVMPTDDMQQIDSPVAFGNGDLDDFERSAIRAAYESLPLRWRTVLWHLDIEGRKPHELGPLLGLSANSVSALVYRARAGLREAYLQQHVKDDQPGDSVTCAEHRAKLSAFVRRTASVRDQERVHTHLESCADCMAIYLDLKEVNRDVGLVTGTVATVGAVGAVGLTLASWSTQITMLLKSVAAVIVPPAAAAAIASATIIGIPTSSPEAARSSLATGSAQRSEVRSAGPTRPPMSPPATSVRAAGPRDVSRVDAASLPAGSIVSGHEQPAPAPRHSVPSSAPPSDVPAATPRPTLAPTQPERSDTPAASAPSATPPLAVRVDPGTSDGVTAPRLAATIGSVELAVGGATEPVSLTIGR